MDKDELIIAFLKKVTEPPQTQSGLARELGYDSTFINHIINGRKTIGLDVVAKIAKHFGLSIDELVFKPEDRAPAYSDAVSILSAYEKLLHSDPDKARIVRVNLGIEKIGSSQLETAAKQALQPKEHKQS